MKLATSAVLQSAPHFVFSLKHVYWSRVRKRLWQKSKPGRSYLGSAYNPQEALIGKAGSRACLGKKVPMKMFAEPFVACSINGACSKNAFIIPFLMQKKCSARPELWSEAAPVPTPFMLSHAPCLAAKMLSLHIFALPATVSCHRAYAHSHS